MTILLQIRDLSYAETPHQNSRAVRKESKNEKDKNTYALIASNDVVLAPGERVALKGKKTKDDSGKLSFEVHKLVKDYGSCKQ